MKDNVTIQNPIRGTQLCMALNSYKMIIDGGQCIDQQKKLGRNEAEMDGLLESL